MLCPAPMPQALAWPPDAVWPVVYTYTIHIMPDDMVVPSPAVLAYRVGALRTSPNGDSANFALTESSELRPNGVLRS